MQIVEVKISELIPAEYNPRRLTKKQFSDVEASLKKFGFVDPVIVNKHQDRQNIIVGGHQRVKVWEKLGNETVPVFFVELDQDSERELNIRLNKNTGEFDFDILANEFNIEDLCKWGFDEFELLGISESFGIDETIGDDDIPPTPKNSITVPGDLYELNNHRLLCGDSSSVDDAQRLMDGNLADLVFTDPPYGVSYQGKTSDKLEIENDDLEPDELKSKVAEWFSVVDFVSRPGAYLLATVPPGPLHLIFAQDWTDRGWLRQIMVWNKSQMVMGHSEYHYKHEPILFGWKPGDRLKNTDRTKTTVWEFDKPSANRDHPTMKPVEMWEYGIKNHTKPGDLLFEPFGGSGTAIIAAQKLKRRCNAIEIDPRYCDAIVKRFISFCEKNNIDCQIKQNGEPINNAEFLSEK